MRNKNATLNLFQYKTLSEIQSPLRYPGGKQKLVKYLKKYFPENYDEYREPFFGGGSVFFNILKQQKCNNFWVNDLNIEVYYFWQQARDNLHQLINKIKEMQLMGRNIGGRSLWNTLVYKNGVKCKNFIEIEKLTPLERAARFFVLNRTTFSGTIECGGYSQDAFERRFTDSSIEKLSRIEGTLNSVKITNLDYSELLKPSDSNIFIFLDPPYLKNKNSRPYGRRGGLLHRLFDHSLLAKNLKNCNHQWLMTCDDSGEIRDLFAFANIKSFEAYYSLNSASVKVSRTNKELLISNFEFIN